MPWTNFHSHTRYSDGKGEPEAYVKAAIEQDVKIYGFADHAPVDFETSWAMKHNEVQYYLAEIDELKTKYSGQLEIYRSMEVDYIPGIISVNHPAIKAANLDYTVGSVHFINQFKNGEHWCIDWTKKEFNKGVDEIYGGDLQKAVEDYFMRTRKMVVEDPPDVVGHIDKVKMNGQHHPGFSETANWYKEAVFETLETIKKRGLIVEVNTRGLYKKVSAEAYPSPFVLKRILELGIPVQINSDCHHPREITGVFQETAELLLSLGFKTLTVFHQSEWRAYPFTKEGIILS